MRNKHRNSTYRNSDSCSVEIIDVLAIETDVSMDTRVEWTCVVCVCGSAREESRDDGGRRRCTRTLR